MLITTVEENKSKLSAYDFNKAKLAWSIQRRIRRPKTQDFIKYVRDNLIPNCPITAQDVRNRNAEFIWGPDLGSLKGKTVRKHSPAIRAESYTIPLSIMQQYGHITLSTDIMKVNGIPFFMTISKHLKFGSAGKLDSMEHSMILKHFRLVMGVYAIQGFKVTIIMADNQFESMRGEFANTGAIINMVSRDEHIPKIGRNNRTIKEHVQAGYNILPFNHMPPILIIELVYSQVFWCNMFTLKGGISPTQSPSEIILNQKLDLNTHCKVEFGEYIQTHKEHDNSMATHTFGAIATCPMGNTQGGYYFIRLDTSHRINRRDWTSLPMPQMVIDQVHRLARWAKSKKKLTFTNMYANLLDDDHDDDASVPTGVNHEDDADDSNSSDDNNSEYDPNNDNNAIEGSENKDYSQNNDSDGENSIDDSTHNMDNNTIDHDSAEPAGLDNELGPETAGVDAPTAYEMEEVDDHIPAAYEDSTAREDDDNSTTSANQNTREYQAPANHYEEGIRMRLRDQPRRNYNVFNISKEKEMEEILLLQFNHSNYCELDERALDSF